MFDAGKFLLEMKMDKIKQTERGWQGHSICKCNFHLNTLLDLDGFKVVVSTVGENYPRYNTESNPPMETVGCDRYYETMVFESSYDEYDDADTQKNIYDESFEWQYPEKDDKLPQAGHWVVVQKVKELMISGKIKKQPDAMEEVKRANKDTEEELKKIKESFDETLSKEDMTGPLWFFTTDNAIKDKISKLCPDLHNLEDLVKEKDKKEKDKKEK